MTGLDAPPEQFAQLADEILNTGHHLRFKALGASMVPFIQNGDILTVAPVDAANIQIGDVAFYRTSGGHVVAHRILGRRNESGQILLKIRGDAAAGPCEDILANQLLGKAITFERNGKTSRLDAPYARLAGRIWAALQPLGYILIRLRHRIRRRSSR